MQPRLYSYLLSLFHSDEEEWCYKTYWLSEGVHVTLSESSKIISQATTGQRERYTCIEKERERERVRERTCVEYSFVHAHVKDLWIQECAFTKEGANRANR